MNYEQRVTRANPACIIFMLDQSGSMQSPIGGSSELKKDVLARSVNRVLHELVEASKRSNELRRYFDVAVVGYGGPYGSAAMPVLGAAWSGDELSLSGPLAAPQRNGEPVGVDALAMNLLREETVQKREPDGAGGVLTIPTSIPIWIEAIAKFRTPMRDGFLLVKEVAARWSNNHPDSLPPIVINVTDGIFTDGDPADVVEALKSVQTRHGGALLFNLHLSSVPGPSLFLPSSAATAPDSYAQLLFEWSSEIPQSFKVAASLKGKTIEDGARGFVFNGDAVMLADLLDIGTPSGLIGAEDPTG